MGRASRLAVAAAVVACATVVAHAASAGLVGPVTTISGPSPFASCDNPVPGNVLNAEVEPWLAVNPLSGVLAAAWQQDRWGDPNEGGSHNLVAWSSSTNTRTWAPFTTCGGGSDATNGNFDRASDEIGRAHV